MVRAAMPTRDRSRVGQVESIYINITRVLALPPPTACSAHTSSLLSCTVLLGRVGERVAKSRSNEHIWSPVDFWSEKEQA